MSLNFLQDIIREKRECVDARKRMLSEKDLIAQFSAGLSQSRFKSILKKPGIHLIAEIKRASPSKGELRGTVNVVDIARLYESNGVEMISVLAEEKFFKGSLADVKQVSENTNLSVLCKDFFIDEYQIYEAKLHGADAILLIASILGNEQILEFIDIARSLEMDAVVEVHSEVELKRIFELGSDIEIVGINQRDLKDFSVDTTLTEKLMPHFKADHLVIAESGISDVQQIEELDEIGVDGVLVGESLMRSEDVESTLKQFMQVIKKRNNS